VSQGRKRQEIRKEFRLGDLLEKVELGYHEDCERIIRLFRGRFVVPY
jgi:hypothetical protein